MFLHLICLVVFFFQLRYVLHLTETAKRGGQHDRGQKVKNALEVFNSLWISSTSSALDTLESIEHRAVHAEQVLTMEKNVIMNMSDDMSDAGRRMVKAGPRAIMDCEVATQDLHGGCVRNLNMAWQFILIRVVYTYETLAFMSFRIVWLCSQARIAQLLRSPAEAVFFTPKPISTSLSVACLPFGAHGSYAHVQPQLLYTVRRMTQ